MTPSDRLSACGMGTDHQCAAKLSFAKRFEEMVGTREAHVSATGPCSMSRTVVFGSSDRRDARTQPAVPPAMTVPNMGWVFARP